jgi:exodeoxyribonuclease X
MSEMIELFGNTVIRVLDVETTGLDPEHGGVCQLAAMNLVVRCDTDNHVWNDDLKVAKSFKTFVDPGCQIPPEASGIHHILDKDVVGAPTFREALIQMQDVLGWCEFYAAHNAPFDSKWVAHEVKKVTGKEPSQKWICTQKASQELFDFANYKLGTLRYELKEPYFDDAAIIGPAHDALADVKVAYLILQRLLKMRDMDDLHAMSIDPVVRNPASRIPFTDFRGLRWADEVPDTILWWIVNKRGMEEGTKLQAKYWLKQRADKKLYVAGGWDDAPRLIAAKQQRIMNERTKSIIVFPTTIPSTH